MIRRVQGLKYRGCLIPRSAIVAKSCLAMLCLMAAGIPQPGFAMDARLVPYVGVAQAPAIRSQSGPEHSPGHADFEREPASEDVRRVADWVVQTNDNHGMPFVIVDKAAARVFLFDMAGRLSGAAPALLGMALGDDPDITIQQRKMADIGPQLRVTPAGRFIATIGHDPAGKEMLWVDYDNSIALHSVVTNRPKERRLERLASPIPSEHRISWGCINVPKKFYENLVSPAFTAKQGVVYVLPETRKASQVFGFD